MCLDGESEGVVAGLAHAHWAPTRSVQMIHASVVPYPRPQLQNEEVKCTSRNTHERVNIFPGVPHVVGDSSELPSRPFTGVLDGQASHSASRHRK